jgi:RNA polymerase sigma factor (sigma-70 family)
VNYAALSSNDLLAECARSGTSGAWEEFIRRFNPVISRSVLRVAMRYGTSDRAQIDDLVQESYLKICANGCKLLKTFTLREPESIFAYLKVVASNVALDYFKSRNAEKRKTETESVTLEDAVVPTASDNSQSSLHPAERAVLINQIDRRLIAVLPASELKRARTVFWLYYRVGFTASAIASLPGLGLTTKGVESLLFRMTGLVREALVGVGVRESAGGKGIQRAESF